MLFGLALILFGVFIFSNFIYMGFTLQHNIFPLMATLDGFADGFYELFSVSFTINLFQALTPAGGDINAWLLVILSSSVWPFIMTWTASGFLVGTIVKGLKRSLFTSSVLFGIVLLLLLVFGFFAGANIGEELINAILSTLGKILSALILFIPLACIGGAISGPEGGN